MFSLNNLVLAPVPVRRGGTVYALTNEPLARSDWKFYATDGQVVARLSSDAYPPSFVADLAPGLYVVRIEAVSIDGRTIKVTKKLVVE